jgi:hypothetical protein
MENRSADQRRHSTAPIAHERPLDKTTMTLESNAPWRTNGRVLSYQRVSLGAFQALQPYAGTWKQPPNSECVHVRQVDWW